MGVKLNRTVARWGRSFMAWLNGNTFQIVLILSLVHIGLAYIHSWDSGRADSFPNHRCHSINLSLRHEDSGRSAPAPAET